MNTIEQAVAGLTARRHEILRELETVNATLQMYAEIQQGGAGHTSATTTTTTTTSLSPRSAKKNTKGIHSDETREKISRSAKVAWVLRRARALEGRKAKKAS